MTTFKSMRSGGAGGGALFHDGGVEALAKVVGELVDFVFAIDGDGLAGGVE